MSFHPGFEYFLKFSNEIKRENRYFVNPEYLEIFNIIINQNSCTLDKGTILFRGRINKKDENENTPIDCSQLGMPKSEEFTSNGRANPYGINYFYLSSNSDTVIAELRPNIQNFISIGEFKLEENKKFIKLGGIASIGGSINDEWDSNFVCMFMLYLILSFSTPVNKSINELDYLPSQYFSEYCKKMGFDGVMFLSSVMEQESDENYNFVFFNDMDIECVSSSVHRVSAISYSAREI